MTQPHPGVSSPIAGSVLPLQRAEELIATLAGVVSVRIVSTDTGNVEAIHVLVTGDTPAKQMVRNIESALMAQLGMRVDHRKVSVATTTARADAVSLLSAPGAAVSSAKATPLTLPTPVAEGAALEATPVDDAGRALYFEDVELRGSRAKGVTCKVTVRRGRELFVGEAEGVETGDRNRVELSARAAMQAVVLADGGARSLTLEGVKIVSAFDRELVVVGLRAKTGRSSTLLTGCCEVKDNSETAGALAVLNATNRWVDGMR